jgi:hypothetical protein
VNGSRFGSCLAAGRGTWLYTRGQGVRYKVFEASGYGRWQLLFMVMDSLGRLPNVSHYMVWDRVSGMR